MHSYALAAAFIASAAAVPFGRPPFMPPGSGPPGSGPPGPPGPPIDSDCEVVYVTVDPETMSTPASSSAMPTHHHHHHHHQHSSMPADTWSSSALASSSASYAVGSSSGAASSSAAPASSVAPGSSWIPASSSIVASSSFIASSAPISSAPAGPHTTFPYPSGSTVVTTTDATGSVGTYSFDYSPPTQMTWTPSGSAFPTAAISTSYVLTTTNSASQTGVTTTTTMEAACTSIPQDYKQTALDLHNELRANHSTNPLMWDDDLACIAQRQAQSCIFDHLMYVDGGGYGQNIAGGTNEDISGAVGSWSSEGPNYDPYYGEANPGGNFEDYGHFSQMIWAYSTSLGCFTATCSDSNTQTVCNYYGTGNMGNEYSVYVLPAKS